jgi:hypothetical protein
VKNVLPVLIGIVAVVLIGGIGLMMTMRGPSSPPPAPPTAPGSAIPTTPTLGFQTPERVLTGKVAPSRTWYGLTLGTSGEADVDKWLADRTIPCTVAPNPTHMTRLWKCTEGLDGLILDGRPHQGPVHDLFFARPDEGALHYISIARRYSVVDQALSDYTAVVGAVTATLGEPTKAKPAPAHIDDSQTMLRYATTWNYDDLDVSVNVIRVMVDYVTVNEVWSVPGIEPAPPRIKTPFDGKPNPHVEPEPSTNP